MQKKKEEQRQQHHHGHTSRVVLISFLQPPLRPPLLSDTRGTGTGRHPCDGGGTLERRSAGKRHRVLGYTSTCSEVHTTVQGPLSRLFSSAAAARRRGCHDPLPPPPTHEYKRRFISINNKLASLFHHPFPRCSPPPSPRDGDKSICQEPPSPLEGAARGKRREGESSKRKARLPFTPHFQRLTPASASQPLSNVRKKKRHRNAKQNGGPGGKTRATLASFSPLVPLGWVSVRLVHVYVRRTATRLSKSNSTTTGLP
jgi:hypothetical protein